MKEDLTQYKVWAKPGDKIRVGREGFLRVITDEYEIVSITTGYVWMPKVKEWLRGEPLTLINKYFPVDKYYLGDFFTVGERCLDDIPLDYIPPEARPPDTLTAERIETASLRIVLSDDPKLVESYEFSCKEWALSALSGADHWTLTRKKKGSCGCER